jgi:hypothetical protein
LKPEIGQSNYWAAIIAGVRCKWEAFSQQISDYFNGTYGRFPLANSGLGNFAENAS